MAKAMRNGSIFLLLLLVTAVHAQQAEPAPRRVGEQRLFNLAGQSHHAELRLVGEHSYLYTVANGAHDLLASDEGLQHLGALFDGQIYRQALELWRVADPPHIDGDERIVILLASGFEEALDGAIGWYASQGPPHAPGSGIGYLAIAPRGTTAENLHWDVVYYSRVLAHEFGHLLHHHAGGQNRLPWVAEGLAAFTGNQLAPELTRYWQEHSTFSAALGDFTKTDKQLNRHLPEDPAYNIHMLFMTYIYERLGAQALLDFATHSRQGLDALDALLAERAAGIDADDFFADWALANYLADGSAKTAASAIRD